MHLFEFVNEEDLIELTKTLVAIPSVTGNEKAIGDWLVERFKKNDVTNIHRFPVEEAGDTIVGIIGDPDTNVALMLNFHLDTFDVFEGWKTDPFKPLVRDGKIIGLGAHDMKGGMACILTAVEALIKSQTKLGGRLIVSGTSDEEYWSRGVHELIKFGMLEDIDYCIVAEPASKGSIIIGQRGRHVIKIRFYGSSGSAAYDEGVNSLVDAAKVVNDLEALKPSALGIMEDYGVRGTLCVTGFHSGGDKIYVPEYAEVTIDRHILPGQTIEWAVEQIKEVIEGSVIKSRYEISWDERPTPAPTSYITNPNSKFVTTARENLEAEIDQEVKLNLAWSVADTNHIAVYGGIPTIILGPSGGNTCEANEWVNTESLPKITRALINTVIDLIGTQ
ncbi:MAG: M20 family metallopeptidase [Promethearchaeota archaeon]|jgi:acetylornithine deacetylase/succinyl-diaminopimelate desuccinylase-like protein